jgi:hypothetical protein
LREGAAGPAFQGDRGQHGGAHEFRQDMVPPRIRRRRRLKRRKMKNGLRVGRGRSELLNLPEVFDVERAASRLAGRSMPG